MDEWKITFDEWKITFDAWIFFGEYWHKKPTIPNDTRFVYISICVSYQTLQFFYFFGKIKLIQKTLKLDLFLLFTYKDEILTKVTAPLD